ncbi:MAG: hypothetical protein IT170_07170 [Bryobacterales bacterium]|nr:hypothetical protein [Bryobacterales bacterium]
MVVYEDTAGVAALESQPQAGGCSMDSLREAVLLLDGGRWLGSRSTGLRPWLVHAALRALHAGFGEGALRDVRLAFAALWVKMVEPVGD